MNKTFSNIIIFNNKDIKYIKEKIEKILIDLKYSITDKSNYTYQIDIIHDSINNICIISSEYFKFRDINSNKSVIRKIAKRVAQDTFMASASENFAIIEKYSFNKRTYDYIDFGNKEELESLGYVETFENYMYKEVWKNHFVGRNTIDDLDKIITEKNSFFESYEPVVEILKLYGIKPYLTTYKVNDNIMMQDLEKEIIYIK